MQYSADVRNARLDAVETTVGPSPTLKLFTGAVPANCAAADSGTLLASAALPADWLADAANGQKTMLGDWEDASADGTGNAGHFRIYSSGGACKIQGTCSLAGGGGDMILINLSFATGQPFEADGFTLTAGNA